MPRLFVGIDLPADVKQRLLALAGGIPGARWQTEEQLHLTLRFIGDVNIHVANDISSSLGTLHMAPFEIALSGVGQFGDKRPHIVWAGLEESPPLLRLNAKVEQALKTLGLAAETRKYIPHVTLARMKNPPRSRVLQFLSEYGLFRTDFFTVSAFHLFESRLGSAGAAYRIISTFELAE